MKRTIDYSKIGMNISDNFSGEIKRIRICTEQDGLYDTEYMDGTKTYDTYNNGKVYIEKKEYVNLIDKFCDDPSSVNIYQEMENESEEFQLKVLSIIN